MKTDKAFHKAVIEVLAPFDVTSRAMFGGYGLYKGKVIFGSLVENQLYFRFDEKTKSDFDSYESEPFIFEGMGKPVIMPYMTLPEEIFRDPPKLKEWIQRAVEASLRYKLKSKKKPKLKQFQKQ